MRQHVFKDAFVSLDRVARESYGKMDPSVIWLFTISSYTTCKSVSFNNWYGMINLSFGYPLM